MRHTGVMTLPAAVIDQAGFDAAVRRTEEHLRSQQSIVQVRYTLDHDRDGDPVVWFRVVLPDKFVSGLDLMVITDLVSFTIEREVDPLGLWGVYPHYRFRSKTEHDAIHEPAWA